MLVACLLLAGTAVAQAGGDSGKKEGDSGAPAPGDDAKPAPVDPKVQPKAEPKPAAKPDPKPEPKPDPKGESKPAPAPKTEPKPEPKEEAGASGEGFSPKISGTISAKYKIRVTDYRDSETGDKVDESDQDLDLRLSLSVKNLYQDKVHFHMAGGYNFDLIGRQDSKHRAEVFEFADIYDTYDSKAHGQLHYGYFESEDFLIEGLGMKLGRFGIEKGESLHIDGFAASYEPDKALKVTVFAGLPVYFWKHHMLDNFTAGFYIELLPFHLTEDVPGDSTKLTIEYIYISEDQNEAGIEDNFFSFTLNQKLFNRTVDLEARATVLDGNFRDFKIRGTLREPENDIRLRLMYHALPVKLEDDISIDMSPFVEVMGRYNPYNEFKLDLYKGFGDDFGLELGYQGRMLKKERYESRFNHDFDRLYATGSAYNFLDSHLDISFTVEYIQSMTPEDEDKILTLGLDLTYKFNEQLKFGIGTHYNRWEMVYLGSTDTVEELENVRVFSLFIDFRPVKNLKIGLNYSFETVGGDLEREYDRFMLSATYSF